MCVVGDCPASLAYSANARRFACQTGYSLQRSFRNRRLKDELDNLHP